MIKISKMTYTGGPLNELNGKMGISDPSKSVPIMKLIRVHKPKSKDELVELIKYHSENICTCGVKSQGTIKSFGENLYESQMQYWKEYKYTLEECIKWEHDLFITQSLKGDLMEKKAVSELSKQILDYTFSEAEEYIDEELRVDIIIAKNVETVGGIQVKPQTFKKMRREIITFNKEANKKWGKPVLYLYYDDSEDFINIDEIIIEIKKL